MAGTLFGRRLRNEMLRTWNYRNNGKYMGKVSKSKEGPLSTPGFDSELGVGTMCCLILTL